MRNNKGITMISLVITIIVLLIVTSITVYNGLEQLGIKRLNNLYSDIESLSTKVAEYYLKKETLPVLEEEYVNNTQELETIFRSNGATTDIANVNDEGAYYVLDLSKLDNLTLNYGDEYKDWTSTSSANDIQNIYIINSVTHQIYFPHGVKAGDEYFFAKFPDDTEIEQITLEAIEGELDANITNITGNMLENNKISVVADVTLEGNLNNYDLNTLEYVWSEIDTEANDRNLSYTKFNIDESTASAKLSSKGLSNIEEYYYLYLKVRNKNGGYNYNKFENAASPITGNLPRNYQRVEYIENAESQYIDTDVIANQNTKIELEIVANVDSLSGVAAIFGARENVNVKSFGLWSIPPLRADIGDKQFSATQLVANTKYTIYMDKTKIKINNDEYTLEQTENFETPGPLTIFRVTAYRNNRTLVDTRSFLMKLYKCKIWQGNEITRDFIPCYRKVDEVKGLYDLVEGKFYTNQVTTGNDFTIGESVY